MIKRQSAAEECRAALAHRFLKQSFRQRRGHLRADGKRPGALSEDGHVAEISAERRMVVGPPLKRRQLVEQAVVARGIPSGLFRELWMDKESKNSQAVVHRNHHDALLRQMCAVLPRFRSSSR